MQTPAILNFSSQPAAKGAAGKTASSSDSTFNQMFSQQVAERREAGKPAHVRSGEKSPSQTTRQAEAKQQTAASGKPQDAKQTSENGETKEAKASEDRKEQTSDTAATPTATELLAQLAGMQLQPQGNNEPRPASGEAEVSVDMPSLKEGQMSLASAESELAKHETTVDGGQAEFDATLRDAGQREAETMHADTTATDIAAASQDATTKSGAEKFGELPATAKAPEPPVAATVAQLQPAMLEAARAAEGKPMERLTPHVGTPAWDQALGQKVVWMVAGSQQSASLTLNPPDLGPMQVVLNVSNGQADASFYAAQPEVRQALEAALPKLRDMLDQAGVALGQTSVSAGMPDRHNEASSQAASQGGQRASGVGGTDEASAAVTSPVQTAVGRGLVDAYA